jgi:hypothetical protein
MTRLPESEKELSMETVSKFLTPGILLVLTLAFGLWLSLTGKPYNGFLFNLHKLIALAGVVVTVIQIYQSTRSMQPQALLIVAIVLAILGVVALFATGAFMSAGKFSYPVMLSIHRIGLVMTPLALAGIVYLLTGRKL